MTKKPNKPLIAILIQRECSRLISQVKSLEKLVHEVYSEKEYQRLLGIAEKWQELLTNEECKKRLLNALYTFAETYRDQDDYLQEDYYELLFQAGIYRKAHWGHVRECLGSFSDCMNDFGAVLPEYKQKFRRKYGQPSVEEQSRLLKKQLSMMPSRRGIELLEHGLMDENGFVPLGKDRAFEILEEKKRMPKPGKVLDFFRRKT